jgi:cytoskeleton protein RodZ
MNEPGQNPQPDAGSERPVPENSFASPGKKLASLREDHGWTVEQVAGQLNLAPRQVVAIEHDDYAALPGTAVTRGFIRAYAKLLKVDGTPFLALLPTDKVLPDEAASPRRIMPTRVPESRFPSMSDRPGFSAKKLAPVALVAVVAAAGWFAYQSGALSLLTRDDGPANVETIPAETQEKIVELPKPPMPSAPSQTPDQSSAPSGAAPVTGTTNAQAPAPAASPGRSVGDAASPAQASPPSAPATAAAPPVPAGNAGQASAAPAKQAMESTGAAGKEALVLKVNADSWIEIRRQDNTTLISKVAKAGTTETFDLSGPVTLTVGNASAVEATLRGNPVDLKANKVNNVARLKLK